MAVLKWIGIGLLGLVALVAVGAGIALAVFDWNDARGFVARQATKALGREVAIDGTFSVKIGDPIRIHVEGLRVANVEWAAEKTFAELKVLDAEVRLWPLLRGNIEVPKLLLTEPKLDMEKNKEGENNWTFGSDPRKAAAKETVKPDNRHEIPIIEAMEIDGGRVRYRDPGRQIDVNTTIATATGGNGDQEVRLDGKGNFAGKGFTMLVKGGGLRFLRDDTRPYPVLIEAAVGKTRGKVEGSVKDPIKLEGEDLSIELRGDDLAEIFPIFGVPVPKTRPYSLSGHLGHQGEVWTFSGMQGRVGESDLNGKVAIDLGGERPRITGDLTSKRLAALDLAGFVGGSPKGKEDYPTKGPGRILPATEINLDMLRSADMDVRFRGGRVEAPFAALEDLDAKIALDNGRLTVEPLKLGIGGGQVAGIAMLDSRDRKTPALKTNLEVRRVKLAEMFRQTQFAKDMGGTLTGRIELAGKGPSPADILAGADGKLGLAVDGGRITSLAVKGLKTNILETLGVALSGSQPLPFNCFVVDMDLKNGLATANALVLDTPETLVTGGGGINLKTEALDLRILGRSKKPQIFATHVPVLVRGTLGDPNIGVDATESVARGAAAVALGALLTPLASVLALADTGTGEQAHCGQLVQDAKTPSGKSGVGTGSSGGKRDKPPQGSGR
ncbi:AsmA family protein [Azospirillum sp.]|uniref:AsmA family protein n=1 Tax=Azospirillum sp. TaxID=34012 RepID=UPI003D718AA4